jgi:hypothetical protein
MAPGVKSVLARLGCLVTASRKGTPTVRGGCPFWETVHAAWTDGKCGTEPDVLAAAAVAAATERIGHRAYDLVLCATGFMSHSTERTVRLACQGAGVLSVRVGKGRVVAGE